MRAQRVVGCVSKVKPPNSKREATFQTLSLTRNPHSSGAETLNKPTGTLVVTIIATLLATLHNS